MDLFLKASAVAIITVVICLIVAKQAKDFSMLICIVVCGLIFMAAAWYLKPIIDFILKLKSVGGLDDGLISVLLKAVGIGLLSEISVMICTDSGHGSVGKTLQVLAGTVVLWLALPVFTKLLDLIQNILGEL